MARRRASIGLVAAVLAATFVGADVRDDRVIGQVGDSGPIGWWRSDVGVVGGAAPVVADGVVYTASPDGTVTAFDALTGAQRWRTISTESIVASPTVAGGSVIVTSDAGTVRSLDAGTGVQRWAAALGQHVEAAVAATPGSIYVGAGTSLLALDASNGAVIWTLDLGGSLLTAPVVIDDRVLVASGFSMCAVTGVTGALLWCQDIGTAATSSPSIIGSTVVVGGWDGSVVAMGSADGASLWRAATVDGAPAMVVAADGHAVVADGEGHVAALDADTGGESWRADLGRRAVGPPQAADGLLYVTTADGGLSVLRAADGSVAWHYGVGVGTSPATAADGIAYAVTSGGGLVAVGDASDARRPPQVVTDADPAAATKVAGGGPSRSGAQPGPGPASSPIVAWSLDVGSDIEAAPVIADGLVLTGSGTFLFAVDDRTGLERWRFATRNRVSQSPAAAGRQVFVGDDDGALYAVGIADGQAAWKVVLDAPVSEAIVADADTVLVAEREGPLVALDPATGQERWRVHGGSSPAIAGGIVYLHTTNGLLAVDETTGSPRWTTPVDFEVPPSVSGGYVYVRTPDGLVRVLDALTGIEQPVTMTGRGGLAIGDGVAVMGSSSALLKGIDLATGWTRWSSGTVSDRVGFVPTAPVIAGDTAYVGATDGSGDLHAVDVLTGAERWRFDAGANVLLTQPSVLDGVVYVGAGSTLWALAAPDAVPLSTHEPEPSPSDVAASPGPAASAATSPAPVTGGMPGGDPGRSGTQPGPAPRTEPAERWRFTADGSLGGTVVVDGVVYVVDSIGTVHAIDAAAGTELWRAEMSFEPAVPVTPLVAGGVVYNLDGVQLHALDRASGTELWTVTIENSGGGPTLAGNALLASGWGTVTSVDIGGGRGVARWTFTDQPLLDAGVAILDPAVAGGSVLAVEPWSAGAGSPALISLDGTTGTEQWRADEIEGQLIVAPVAVADGVAYAGGAEGSLGAFDITTGDLLWAADTGATVTSAPAIGGGLVIVGNTDGDVVAIDVATGAERWRYSAADVVAAAPSIAGDIVVLASQDGQVHGLDLASGQELWSVASGGAPGGAPSVVDGAVYVTAGQDVVAYGQ